jgi:hypothetical protein
MITILKLIAAHLIGDFFLQPDWIAKNKRNSWITLCLHSLINAAAVYVILGMWTLWWVPLIIFLSHLIIDYTKTHYGDDNVKWFIGD